MSKVVSSFVATAVSFNPREWKFDVLVDYSSSMLKSIRDGYSRANQAKELTLGLFCELTQLGVPAIDFYRFNNGAVHHVPEVKSMAELESAMIARIVGGTPLDLALEMALLNSRNSELKKCCIVLLDGEPDSKSETERILKEHVNALTSAQNDMILFVQIGGEVEATEWLQHLDNKLVAKYDVITTVTSEEFGQYPTLLAMLAAAIGSNK